jgi:hypothetical protein
MLMEENVPVSNLTGGMWRSGEAYENNPDKPPTGKIRDYEIAVGGG